MTTTSRPSVDANELAWPALEGSGMSPGNGRYRAYGPRNLEDIGRRYGLAPEAVETVDALAHVIPFRVNDYVLENMVDWDNVPGDPLYQLVFPQPGMLSAPATGELVSLRRQGWPRGRTQQLVRSIRQGLNPHPSGQRELNVPYAGENPIPGLQHKYIETVLYFPAHGQTCHAYCTYCFRWAQFVGDADLKFAAPNPVALLDYLRTHPRVTDLLVTGGDPLIMSTDRLISHVEPLLQVGSLQTVRFGTKALAYWPDRFVGDADAADLLRLFERIVDTGRTCAVMAHFSHPRELETSVVIEAIRRIRGTGAQIYCQAPLIARVNDDAEAWNTLWRHELRLGTVPYYMFIERDTGPHDYFQVPLARAVQIFQDAYRRLPGLARTVRGPVMSATPGKVMVDGAAPVDTGLQLSLRFLQARDPGVVGTPFTARCHPDTSWLTDVDSFEAPPRVLAALRQSGGPAEGSAS